MRCSIKRLYKSLLSVSIGLLLVLTVRPAGSWQAFAASIAEPELDFAAGLEPGQEAGEMDYQLFLPMVRKGTVPPTAGIDLRLTMTSGGVSSVVPGGTLTYKLAFTNDGGHEATSVSILETLPASTAFDSVHSSAGWTQVGSTAQYRMDLGTLSAGQYGSVVFAVVVSDAPPALVTSVTNEASIQDDGSHGADPTPSNNLAAITTAINFAPDLAVTVSGDSLAIPGTVTAYSVQYSNLGYNAAEGVVITETLPEFTSYDPADNTVNWVLNGDGQYEYVLGSLAKGASGTLTFNVRVNQTIPSGTTSITNTASISDNLASGSDPNPANNTATFATPLPTGPTYTCGDITSDTRWTAGESPYVLTCDITIHPGATLTIEHGVVVKFQAISSIVVNGTLDVQGTQAQPVIITSLLDDSAGGDTNGDGSATSPAPGNWNSIIVASTGTVDMAYAAVRYGGFYWCGVNCYGNNTALHVYGGGNVTLDHVTLAHNGGHGVTVNPSATAQLTVTHSTIESSGLNGINATGISGNSITITDNVFTGNANEAVYLAFNGGSVNDLGGNTGSGNGINGILLTGALGMDTTLAGNPDFAYVIYGVTVNSGSTLTVQPGAVVKFRETTNGTLAVNGSLMVPGTETAQVTFTSLNDDSVAGDTNNNGTATSPAPGNWNSIAVSATGTANLAYAAVRYGGYYWCGVNCYGENAALRVYDGGSLTLDHGNIANSGGNGVAVNPSATTQLTVTHSTIGSSGLNGINATGISGNQITITDNVFTGNVYEAVYLAFTGGAVSNLGGNTGTGNGVNGILLTGTLGMDTTLAGNPDFAYVIYGVTVNSGSTLTVQPGAVVKFRESTNGTLLINGILNVPGTVDSAVTFTSLNDDTVAGDTNNNGSATSPAAGDWNSIVVAAGGTTNMIYANLRYGGFYWCGVNCYGYDAMLQLQDSASATLQHSVFSHSPGALIQAAAGSGTITLTIEYSMIGNPGATGIRISPSGTYVVAVHHNNIIGNSNYGIYNASSSPVDAVNNWWGSDSGPAPYGTGNAVYGSVNVTPWLTAPEPLP